MPIKRPTIDPAREARLIQQAKDAFDSKGDDEIDYDDIPDMGDTDWARRAPKSVVTMRLEGDVVAFFKGDAPEGYTRRMAAVLTAFARKNLADR